MSDHACPYPGCAVQVSFTQLACRPHWFLLPRPLRNKIWAAWRADRFDEHAELLAKAQELYDQHAATRGTS